MTSKAVAEKPNMEQAIEDFKVVVRSQIEEFGLQCMYNTDQSDFEYEMHPGRTLHSSGEKHVLALSRSQNSMTHSYTIMMTVSAGDQKFLLILFVTLEEHKGVFGPRVQQSMFRADNLHITSSESGKRTKKLYHEYCQKALFHMWFSLYPSG